MKKLTLLAASAIIAFSLSGCLVDNDKFEEAKRERDEYRQALQEIRLANDLLNRKVAAVLAEREAISVQLAVQAAMGLQQALVVESKLLEKPSTTRRPRGAGQQNG